MVKPKPLRGVKSGADDMIATVLASVHVLASDRMRPSEGRTLRERLARTPRSVHAAVAKEF